MNIALLGFGTVGKEVALSLQNSSLHYHSHLNTITLKRIYTRTPAKIQEAGLASNLIADSVQSIVDDPQIDCVVELIGGTDDALFMVRDSLEAGKHVITANKALLAHHGMELWQRARNKSLVLGFEASCAGGIPIIKTLTEGLAGDYIHKIYGVLNGTCNFILSQMENQGISFKEALALAQSEGYAEADSSLDIGGLDAGHKLCIMSGLSYNSIIHFKDIPIKGIDTCDSFDISFARRLDYRIKLIAYSQILHKDDISDAIDADIPEEYTNTHAHRTRTMLWVHPAMLPDRHPMAHLQGSYNAVSVFSHKAGHTLYYGKGAGASPTASAVLSDLVSLNRECSHHVFTQSHLWPDINTVQNQVGMEFLRCKWYLRFVVRDELGVLAKIAELLSTHGISIARALQEESKNTPLNAQSTDTTAILIIITHDSYYYHVQKALATIKQTPLLVQDLLAQTIVAYPIIPVPQ